MGKHDDFVFEGVKASNKPVKKLVLNSDARKNDAKKSQTAFGMHKEHHKSLTKYVMVFVAILLVVSIVGFNYSKVNNNNSFSPDKSKVLSSDQQAPAQAANDPCSGLQGIDKEQCTKLNLINQAILSNDISLCKKDSSCEDAFYFQAAQGKGELESCNNIKDENAKKSCTDTVNEQLNAADPERRVRQEVSEKKRAPDDVDLKSCDGLTGFEMTKCVDNIVIAKTLAENDLSYCQLAADIKFCHGYYYKQQAIAFGNKQFCEKIEHAGLRKECEG
ncbi:hypothetical protein J4206_04615 [Candidatus Woesearchaeota archaeon]|nr:hypothetical protein [Candidatus Woesearchaeota archaeon]